MSSHVVHATWFSFDLWWSKRSSQHYYLSKQIQDSPRLCYLPKKWVTKQPTMEQRLPEAMMMTVQYHQFQRRTCQLNFSTGWQLGSPHMTKKSSWGIKLNVFKLRDLLSAMSTTPKRSRTAIPWKSMYFARRRPSTTSCKRTLRQRRPRWKSDGSTSEIQPCSTSIHCLKYAGASSTRSSARTPSCEIRLRIHPGQWIWLTTLLQKRDADQRCDDQRHPGIPSSRIRERKEAPKAGETQAPPAVIPPPQPGNPAAPGHLFKHARKRRGTRNHATNNSSAPRQCFQWRENRQHVSIHTETPSLAKALHRIQSQPHGAYLHKRPMHWNGTSICITILRSRGFRYTSWTGCLLCGDSRTTPGQFHAPIASIQKSGMRACTPSMPDFRGPLSAILRRHESRCGDPREHLGTACPCSLART